MISAFRFVELTVMVVHNWPAWVRLSMRPVFTPAIIWICSGMKLKVLNGILNTVPN